MWREHQLEITYPDRTLSNLLVEFKRGRWLWKMFHVVVFYHFWFYLEIVLSWDCLIQWQWLYIEIVDVLSFILLP